MRHKEVLTFKINTGIMKTDLDLLTYPYAAK